MEAGEDGRGAWMPTPRLVDGHLAVEWPGHERGVRHQAALPALQRGDPLRESARLITSFGELVGELSVGCGLRLQPALDARSELLSQAIAEGSHCNGG